MARNGIAMCTFVMGTIAGLLLGLNSANGGESVGIHGPTRIGVVTQKPFIYRVPATGAEPLQFDASNLPPGLTLDRSTGVITGVAQSNADYDVTVTVKDAASAVSSKHLTFTVAPDALGLTPLMAWNPWYVWGCNIDDAKIRQAADLLVSTGLAAHGYNYINLDDCWQGTRNAQDEIVPNPRFPDMKALADYVHSKGLRIGIYTSPNQSTCGKYAGSYGHIEQDVATYAKWGMDLVKYDWCGATGDEKTAYRFMSDAIAKQPRAIFHSICQYGFQDVWTWGADVGGNSWRTNDDLADTWDAILRNGFANIAIASHQKPGHFNDLDMLMVGKGNWPKQLGQYTIPDLPPRESQLTNDEKLTHLSIWSLLASPLMFSGDLAQMDAATFSQLANDDVLAIDQDEAVIPAQLVSKTSDSVVISRKLSDGSMAVGYFNLGVKPLAMTSDFMQLGLPSVTSALRVTDLWNHRSVQTTATGLELKIPPHGVALVRIEKP